MRAGVSRAFLILPAVLLLAACGDGGGPRLIPTASRPEPGKPVARPALREPGLAGVIGADAGALIRQFGAPRLDIREGDARKLQWSGTACILDAYLYPVPGASEGQASFVDARRGDGRDVDRAACIAALRKPAAP